MPIQITETLYVTSRAEWRRWLESRYRSEPDIWLVCYRKHTGRACLSYNDAVEEALCFGWIDSTVKTIDQDRYAQRYSPRRARSGYSQTNKERLKRLIERGQVAPDVLASLASVDLEAFQTPDDVLAALRADAEAWAHWRTFSGAYQRIRLAYVDTARDRPDEFAKRMKNLVQKTAKGRQFGRDIATYY